MARADTKMWLVGLAGSALMACSGAPTQERPRSPASILIVTIDTLRADRLGRGFTPTLDNLAAQSLSLSSASARSASASTSERE